MRRGVETAHTVWGNTVAILTGDMIFAGPPPWSPHSARNP